MSASDATPEEEWVNTNAPHVLGVDASQLMTTQLFNIVDDYDDLVIRQVMGIFNHQNAKIVLDAHKNGVFEKAHSHVINMCFSLVSVNAHRRNYHAKLDTARQQAKDKMEEWQSPYETAIYDQDITIEVIGALISLKSALDSLAQAISVIYGFNDLKSWKRNGDGVLKALRKNIPKDDAPKVERLIKFIEQHQSLTKEYIDLRDNLGHGLTEYKNTISGFFKRKIDTQVQNPRIQMGDKVIDCGDLVDGCAKVGSEYAREVVGIILSSVIPGVEVGDLEGKYVWLHNVVAVSDMHEGRV